MDIQKNHDTPININNIQNPNSKLLGKLLKLQFADAKAHDPKYDKKRVDFLNDIKKQLEEKYIER